MSPAERTAEPPPPPRLIERALHSADPPLHLFRTPFNGQRRGGEIGPVDDPVLRREDDVGGLELFFVESVAYQEIGARDDIESVARLCKCP